MGPADRADPREPRDQAARHRPQIAERVAACALLEFAKPHCRACGGAGETLVGEVRVTCSRCGGSRVERYCNAERREAIGTYGARIDAALADCHQDLANALDGFLGHVAGRNG